MPGYPCPGVLSLLLPLIRSLQVGPGAKKEVECEHSGS